MPACHRENAIHICYLMEAHTGSICDQENIGHHSGSRLDALATFLTNYVVFVGSALDDVVS